MSILDSNLPQVMFEFLQVLYIASYFISVHVNLGFICLDSYDNQRESSTRNLHQLLDRNGRFSVISDLHVRAQILFGHVERAKAS